MIVIVVLGSVIERLFAHSLPKTKTLNTSQQFKQAEAEAVVSHAWVNSVLETILAMLYTVTVQLRPRR